DPSIPPQDAIRRRSALLSEDSEFFPEINYTIPSMNQQDAVRQLLEDSGFQARLSALGFFVMDLGNSLDLQETVTTILEHTKRAIPYDKATVQLLEAIWLQVIGTYGFSDPSSTIKLRFNYPVPNNPSTLALQSRKPVTCDDVLADFQEFCKAPGEKPILSWLGIPLIANNEVLGLMALDSVVKGFYTPRHRRMAEMVGSHMALSILCDTDTRGSLEIVERIHCAVHELTFKDLGRKITATDNAPY
ncbi:MAG: GAF domain-containing protein, partial [Spirochaetota bacterium]